MPGDLYIRGVFNLSHTTHYVGKRVSLSLFLGDPSSARVCPLSSSWPFFVEKHGGTYIACDFSLQVLHGVREPALGERPNGLFMLQWEINVKTTLADTPMGEVSRRDLG